MIIPVGYGHVTHFFTGSGLPNGAAVTYGVQLTGSDFIETRAASLHSAWEDSFLTLQMSSVTLAATRLKYGPAVSGQSYDHVEALPGTQSGQQAPPNTAMLVKKITGLGGRKNRGRFYIPGISDDAVSSNGTILPGSLVLWQAEATTFLADLDTRGLPMYLLHNSSSDPTEVSSLGVDGIAATQRRRLR